MFKNALVTLVLVGVTVSLSACSGLPQFNSSPLSKAEQEKATTNREKALERKLLSDLRATRATGKKDPNEAFQIIELVKLYESEKRFPEAVVMMRRAKESWNKTHNKQDSGITYLLTTESNLLSHMGRVADAEKLQLQVLATNQRLVPADSPKLVETLRQVGSFYLANENFKKAEPYFKRAISISDKYPEERSSQNYAELLKCYADVLDHTKRPQQAAAIRSRSVI